MILVSLIVNLWFLFWNFLKKKGLYVNNHFLFFIDQGHEHLCQDRRETARIYHENAFFHVLTDADWSRLILIDPDRSWSILINPANPDRPWSNLINSYQSWSILTVAWLWSILTVRIVIRTETLLKSLLKNLFVL